MKKILVYSVLMSSFILCAHAAAPTQRRTQSAAAQQPVAASARSATARSAAPAKTTSAPTTTSARAAAAGRTTVSRGAGATSAPSGGVVSARAGATQKVIGTGTKVAAATQNIVVNEQCRLKYDGCMDSFCMIENDNGGRCICSDRKTEFDGILAEIKKLDTQSYKMATEGVEKIEMGADADQAIANATAIANRISAGDDTSGVKARRKSLDLSLWNSVDFDEIDEDVFAQADTMQSTVDGKEGDQLNRAAAQICVAQMPECSGDLAMLQMMYGQRIKSDCTAYENELKRQKNDSASKLAAAERALREAALESLRTANKYDLGQCTVQFKQCMSTTAGCKDDFTGCVGIAAAENAKKPGSSKSSMKMVDIKGTYSKISIAASTLDALESKKPMCSNITNSCVAVKDKVWDTFLREVAPQLKTAELLAESDLRTNCIGNISTCFQKACKDTMDPNDPDGSYDMCLSRPETVASLCRVQVEPCVAAEPMIMDFVYARLSSMRVDSCTTEVKECMQSEDRCGEDYSQCVGLDTDTIIRMCPYDKLVGCQKVYNDESKKSIRGDEVYDELSTMVQGIMLNIDNNMLTQCQNAANEAMVKVCGGTENCDGLAVDENIGARSLDYKICEYTGNETNMSIDYAQCRTDISQISDTELGRVQGAKNAGMGPVTPLAGVLDGTIYWESIDFNEDGRLSSVDEYLKKIGVVLNENETNKVKSELAALQKSIDAAINAIEADPKVQFCITGREVQGMKDAKGVRSMIGGKGAGNARFPELTKQMRLLIATSALKAAKGNYYTKYDELSKKMLQDYAKMGERMAEIAGQNALDARREISRVACVSMAEASALPLSPAPPKSAFGKILKTLAVVGSIVAIPLTGGVSAIGIAAIGSGGAGVAATAVGAGFAAAGVGVVAGAALSGNGGSANGAQGGTKLELVGSKQVNQWNYKETIVATFEWETLNCHKCIRSQNCGKTKNPVFGSKYCKSWDDETEKCDDTQF